MKYKTQYTSLQIWHIRQVFPETIADEIVAGERDLSEDEIETRDRAMEAAAREEKKGKIVMKTNITITDKNTDIASFNPVSGVYDLNKTSREMEDVTLGDIEEAIASELSAKHGFAVKVEIFRSNGRAITDETPSAGSFLATRK